MTSTVALAPRPRYDFDSLETSSRFLIEAVWDLNADALQAACPSCRVALSWGQWLSIHGEGEFLCCHHCGECITESYCQRAPHSLVDQLRTPGYFYRLWFHASTDAHWAPTVQEAEHGELLVHAGSELAALARADYLQNRSPRAAIYLHSFRLSDSSKFSRNLLADMGNGRHWQRFLDSPRPLGLAELQDQPVSSSFESLSEATPGAAYYNRYEVPGDISLLFHAALIDLASVETVELTED